MIDEVMEYNKHFVEQQDYLKYRTLTKYPNKKLAVLSCMDTRLTELLPAALGLKNGDAKIIKNAGAVISHPYGSVVRSLLIAILELGVTEIMVVGHRDCGVAHIDVDNLIVKMKDRGVSEEKIDIMKYSGIDFDSWLGGFEDVETSVAETVTLLKKHPLIPKDIDIRGFVINIETGELKSISTNE